MKFRIYFLDSYYKLGSLTFLALAVGLVDSRMTPVVSPHMTVVVPQQSVNTRLDAIKRGLLSEHKSTWGDILSPDGIISNTNRTSAQYNMTAISEAMRKADEVAWQWGFWPFTSIIDE